VGWADVFLKQPWAGLVLASFVTVLGVVATQAVAVLLANVTNKHQLKKTEIERAASSIEARASERLNSLVELSGLLREFQTLAIRASAYVDYFEQGEAAGVFQVTKQEVRDVTLARNEIVHRIVLSCDRYGYLPARLRVEQPMLGAVIETVVNHVVLSESSDYDQLAEIVGVCRSQVRQLLAYERGENESSGFKSFFFNDPVGYIKEIIEQAHPKAPQIASLQPVNEKPSSRVIGGSRGGGGGGSKVYID
jgi:hypothetical protein